MTLPPDYPALLARLDAWQRDVRNRFPGVVPCRAGCTACCHGPFDISAADALEVRSAVAALPEAVRDGVLARARAQVERMEAVDAGFRAPWNVARLGDARFDRLVERFAEEPCPALDGEGRCVIYDHRPMVCRVMGIGMQTAEGELANACPIADDFPAYRALPPQEFDLAAWEVEEAEALRHAADTLFGNAGADYETTIAGAALLGAR